jgi:hypothetical protein
LPRSRTAWFAVACDCLHEPTAGDPALAADLWARGERGISDSGLSRHLPWLLDKVGPRALAIRRPRDQVLASFRRYIGERAELDWHNLELRLAHAEDVMDGVRDHPLVRVLDYAELTLPKVGSAIHWLTGVWPDRLAQLMHMNVQSDLAWNLAMAEAA